MNYGILSVLCAIALCALSSCGKSALSDTADSGLRSNKTYRCDTVSYAQPMRMFAQSGEITDPNVISNYLALRPWLIQEPNPLAGIHPDNIFSSPTQLAYYNGLVPFTASVTDGRLLLKQRDTSVYGAGNPQGSIDYSFKAEQSYQILRDAVLEMNGSYSRLERVDTQNYRNHEAFIIRGTFGGGVITLPYTFVASRLRQNGYPFALKESIAPQVPAGDTLLVWQGRVEFR